MKSSRLLRVFCVGALAAVCSFGLAACGGSDSDSTMADVSDTSGGVAATVNGVEIGENAVTDYIAAFRVNSGLEDNAAWAQWLVDNDYTIKQIRSDVIDYYVSQELIRQAAAENDVTVEAEEVDAQVETMRGYYESEEAWAEALASLGTTEDQYRSMLELSMLQSGLQEKVAKASEPTKEELLSYSQMYGSAYDGAKKSSHILFNADDKKTAQDVLDKINSGKLDFAEAAKQYSQDTGSAGNGGDVGWDKLNTFVDEYQTALDGLNAGEVSGLVTSDYGIHIIKCTEVFNAPKEITSSDQLPKEFVESIKSSLEASSKEAAYSEWYEEYKAAAKIKVNKMPEDLEYKVSLKGVTKSAEATEDDVVEGSVETGAEE